MICLIIFHEMYSPLKHRHANEWHYAARPNTIPHFSVAFAQMAGLQLQSLQTCCESFSHNIFLSGVLIPDDFQLLFYMTAVSETRHAAEQFQRTSTSTTYVKTPAKGFFVQIKLLTGVR